MKNLKTIIYPKIGSIQFIPSFEKTPQKFSVDVSNHPFLKAVYPYWKFLFWFRDREPAKYFEFVDTMYFTNIKEKIQTEFHELIEKEISNLSSLRFDKKVGNSSISSEPFAPGKEAIESIGAGTTQNIRALFSNCFKSIETEIVILREFWGVQEENIQNYSTILKQETLDDFTRIIQTAAQIDPYYNFFCYSLISARSKQTGIHTIPLKHLMDLASRRYDDLIDEQISRLKDSKFITRKTLLLTQIKNFPIFVKNFYDAFSILDAEEGDKSVLDDMMAKLIEELDHWLNEDVLPKFSHSKGNRTHIINLNYLINQFKDTVTGDFLPFIVESNILTTKMDLLKKEYDESMDKFMDWLCYKIWDKASEFFTQINKWREQSGLTNEMVTFQPSHTQDKFAELCRDLDKNKDKKGNEIRNHVNTKIRDEKLKRDILEQLVPHTESVFQKWNDIAQECYGKPIDNINAIIKSLST